MDNSLESAGLHDVAAGTVDAGVPVAGVNGGVAVLAVEARSAVALKTGSRTR